MAVGTRRLLSDWLPVVAWIGVIVGFSSNQFSADNTRHILGPVVRWLLPDLDDESFGLVMFALRKGAHLVEYAVLGALSLHAASSRAGRGRASAFALALALAIAVLDETHQGWLASRTGSPRDVLIDLSGAALGILVWGRWFRSLVVTRG